MVEVEQHQQIVLEVLEDLEVELGDVSHHLSLEEMEIHLLYRLLKEIMEEQV